MGYVSMFYSAAYQEDWYANVSYSAANISVTFTTDEEEVYEISAYVDMGSCVTLYAAMNSSDRRLSALGSRSTLKVKCNDRAV